MEKKTREITIYSCLLILTFTDKRLKKQGILRVNNLPELYSVNQGYQIVVYQIVEQHAMKQSLDQGYQIVGYQTVVTKL